MMIPCSCWRSSLSIHRHVGQPSARSRRTNLCAASLDIEGKKRAMGNRKPCIAHKNKVVAYIGEFRSRTQAEPQAGWGFDSFARMTSAMDCAEFPVGTGSKFHLPVPDFSFYSINGHCNAARSVCRAAEFAFARKPTSAAMLK